MALSGTLNMTTNNEYIDGSLVWSATQNIEGNYSTVTVAFRLWRTNTGYTTTGSGIWNIYLNGSHNTIDKSITLTYNSNTLIGTYTLNVPHNSDGTKTCQIDATGGISGTSYTVTNGGGTVTLDTIARASQPTLIGSPVTMGNSLTINTNRASSSFTHTIRYGFGTTGTIATGVTTSTTWAVPLSLANYVTTSTSGVGRIYCDTYSGSTLIGTKSVVFTANVPSSIIPTVDSITATELNSAVTTVVGSGKYVKGLSNIRIALNGGAGAYGSSMVSYNIKFNGVWHSLATPTYRYDTGILKISGTPSTTEGYVKDTRSRVSVTRTVSPAITILNYAVPIITAFTVERCDSGGIPNELGTYVLITRKATASSLINGTEKNSIACTVGSRIRGDSTYVTIPSCTVTATTNVATGVATPAIIVSGYPIENAYEFELRVPDKFNTTISTKSIAVGITVMSWSKEGIGVGKVWTSGALDVLGQSNFEGNVDCIDLSCHSVNLPKSTLSEDATYLHIDTTLPQIRVGNIIRVAPSTGFLPETNNTCKCGWSINNAWSEVNSFAYVDASDRRLKENIIEMDSARSYDSIKNMKTYGYNYKSDIDTGKGKRAMLGVITDELPIEVLEQEEFEGVNLYSLLTLNISALKEAMVKIDTLELEVQRLGGNI